MSKPRGFSTELGPVLTENRKRAKYQIDQWNTINGTDNTSDPSLRPVDCYTTACVIEGDSERSNLKKSQRAFGFASCPHLCISGWENHMYPAAHLSMASG